MERKIEKRSIKIPTIVWELKEQCKIEAELHIIFEFVLEKDVISGADMSDYEAMENAVECEYFALNIGEECYKAEPPDAFFDLSLEKVCKQLSGKYSQYLEDGQCTIWEAFNAGGRQCYETEVCKQFRPRIGGLGGYRGQVYT